VSLWTRPKHILPRHIAAMISSCTRIHTLHYVS
jgi:hypothetical protein